MAKIKLSVVIPAYNEATNLKSGVLDEVDDYLSKQTFDYEVVIVDDGSRDKTVEMIEDLIKNKSKFRLIKNPHGGKAVTVMTGILKSVGEIIVFTDMDQATPLNQIEKFFPKFDEGYDVVIGARKGREGAPLIRKIPSVGFTILRNIILGLPFSDTQCGFKAFTNQAANLIFPDLLKSWQAMAIKSAAVNAGFDVEALFIAKKQNLKITDVKVNWHYVGSKRVKFFKDSMEALKDLIRIRKNDLQGRYNYK